MDLTSFTSSNKKIEKKEVIIDNNEVKISKQGDNVEFFFKKKEAIEKYQDFLFFSPTHSIETSSEKEAEKFFKKSLSEGVEGLMFKNQDAIYKPGLRSGAMAKLKETKEDIDVVIVAAEHGRGKRAGFYSSFLVAVKNEDFVDENDRFLIIGKVSSGIKELDEGGASLENLTKLLRPLKMHDEKGMVYFEPKIIIQVRYQEIQKSNAYSSGYALRFPRIIMLRDDKDLNEINSIDDISYLLKGL